MSAALAPPAQRFTVAEAEAASDAWLFNCGPGALCGVLELSPEQVRPHLQDFEQKGYSNPTLMFAALRSLGVDYGVQSSTRGAMLEWPKLGLVRVQWGGPWMKPEVPLRARYRQTHWVGSWKRPIDGQIWIYDINAAEWGGWLPLSAWKDHVVPWLLQECVPRNDGTWLMTHAIEVIRG